MPPDAGLKFSSCVFGKCESNYRVLSRTVADEARYSPRYRLRLPTASARNYEQIPARMINGALLSLCGCDQVPASAIACLNVGVSASTSFTGTALPI